MIDLDDTIAALSTTPGASGIAVVKISGPEALAITQKVFVPKSKASTFVPRKMVLGQVIGSEGETIDEALACYMPAPNSYTCQDVIEIQTHGGAAASATLLDLLADAGVRMAGPGEFTQRAFLMGRLDLAQAEAIYDIVHAKTKAGLIAAQRQLAGTLSETVKQMRQSLIEAKALLEANIDFPDEEIGELDRPRLNEILDTVKTKLETLLSTYTSGRLYREGVLCVIAGRPNVGKSSLLNNLLSERRAIVTPTPGTTRDAIEATANINGVPFRLVDTAGIRESGDPIEGEGVRITREQIEKADLVLLMTDASTGVTEAGRKIQREMTDRNVLHLVNKVDLVDNATAETVGDDFGESPLFISAKKGLGIDKLREAMIEAVGGGKTLPTDQALLTNARHRQALLKGKEQIAAARGALAKNRSPELIALELDDAFNALGEIVGETTPDDVLNHIFEQFCIGK